MGNLPPELIRNQGQAQQRMAAWGPQRPDLYPQTSFPPPSTGGIPPQQPPFRYPLSEYMPQGKIFCLHSTYVDRIFWISPERPNLYSKTNFPTPTAGGIPPQKNPFQTPSVRTHATKIL